MKRFLFALAAMAMSYPVAVVADDHAHGGLPTFSGTCEPVRMPETWVQGPIVHQTKEKVDLAVALDQQLFPAFAPMIEAFAKERGVRIDTQDGTCGISAGRLSKKAVDIGGFCCPPGATDRLPGLTFHTIGIAALALIVDSDNRAKTISMANARAIFGGEIIDWNELPKATTQALQSRSVKPVARLHCKIRPGHWRKIHDNRQQFSWNLKEVSEIADMLRDVSSTQGAIGYETLWHIHRMKASENVNVRTLPINNHRPEDNAAIARGDYPLYRVFNLTTWAGPDVENKLAQELVAHLLARTSDLPAKYGIVPASELRKNGWHFLENELIGEPSPKHSD